MRDTRSPVITVAGQRVALGRLHQHRTVTVTVSDTTLAIDLDDGDVKVVRRTTTQAVRSIKGQRPRNLFSGPMPSHEAAETTSAIGAGG